MVPDSFCQSVRDGSDNWTEALYWGKGCGKARGFSETARNYNIQNFEVAVGISTEDTVAFLYTYLLDLLIVTRKDNLIERTTGYLNR